MSTKEVNCAVYHHKAGRWSRVKTFNAEQRDDAKAAAEAAVSAQGVSGVTLVKETYNQVSKSTDEVAVWSSAKPGIPALGVRKAPPGADKPIPAPAASRSRDDNDSPAPARSGGGRNDDFDEEPVLVMRNQPTGTPFLVVFKISTAVALSVTVAGMASWGLGQVNGYALFIMLMGERNILTKVFGLLFFMTLLVALPNMVSWKEFSTAFSVTGGGPKRPQGRRQGGSRAQGRDGRPGGKDARGKNAESNTKGNSKSGSDGNGRQDGGSPEPEKPPATPEPTFGPEVEDGKKSVMTFFSRCIDFLMKTSSSFMKGGKFSSYNHFGCDLFLAGAAEAYAESRGMADKKLDVMASVVAATGRPWDRAKQFAEKHDGYLLEPRYLDMFRSGRDAMQIFLKDEDMRTKAAAGELSKDDEAMLAGEGESDIGIFLEHALDSWNEKKSAPATSGTVTVMFTEVYGAAQFAATNGDDQLRRLSGYHDKIVREALARHEGREIKRNGDGIMAAFTQASAAVEAAIEMQRGADLHTVSTPDLPLHLRIGINAGEPIQENNDLFGTPVQMAARICAAAATDQVLVSKIIKDLCQGKGTKFEDRGTAEMKGFAEPVPIFEAVWKDTVMPE